MNEMIMSTVQKILSHFRAQRTEADRRCNFLGTWREHYCYVL